jgi:signal transduction histidine kinase
MSFFRNLSLTSKFLIIAIVPIGFIIFLSVKIYNYESDKLTLVDKYLASIKQAQRVFNVMDCLQDERRLSFLFSLEKENFPQLTRQRDITDSCIKDLQKVDSIYLADFTSYTYLDNISKVRLQVDSGRMNPEQVMNYYTNVIYRLDDFNDIPSEKISFLQPVYQDLVSQKLLSEMTTLIGVMRWNIYNTLYSKRISQEALLQSSNAYDNFRTYEAQFLSKGDPFFVQKYKKLLSDSALMPVMDYMHSNIKLNKNHKYTADEWQRISSTAVGQIKNLQYQIWDDADKKLNNINKEEIKTRTRTIIILIVVLLFSIAVLVFTLSGIRRMLRKLRLAAEDIAEGKTKTKIGKMPSDDFGLLAKSITKIAQSEAALADIANEISKGNFTSIINPRSSVDKLSNAIIQMQTNLNTLMKMNDELIRKKDEFMSIASHELKTPITSMKTSLQVMQLMSEKDPAFKSLNQLIKQAIKQANKMAAITNDLLDITRLQKGQLELKYSNFTAREMITECYELIKYSLDEHILSYDGNLDLELHADRHRIEQVLINFLTNAIKYSADDGLIKIKAETVENGIKISVSDQGIGISQKQMPFLFSRFFRTEEAKSFSGGLGLGLYISSEIINAHNGQIGADSEVGKGSTFWFIIPIN